jgi:hypothetical protein
MARSEHNREAYRLLFGYVGTGVQVLAGLLILMSFPVAPTWLFVGLSVFVVVTSWWSWRRFDTNFMMPTLVGTAQAILWMMLVGVGVGIVGWSK